jgi:Alw26I/Eco31I/Esp3I family type II restriction m6 adenine DNA methyltransferase
MMGRNCWQDQLDLRALSVPLHTLRAMPVEVSEWRTAEVATQRIATELHRAAAIDLARRPEIWAGIPTDGLVRELLASRTDPRVPSVHLSSAAGHLALVATLAEMGERADSRSVRWRGTSLQAAARTLTKWVPGLCGPHLPSLATGLPALAEARTSLAVLDDVALARLAGRVMESALSCYWVFSSEDVPQRVWHPWVAKQQGCFFTPEFVAKHIASASTRLAGPPSSVLDPAVGAGALLIEAFLKLRPKLGPIEALRRLHGIDVDPALVELTAITLTFLAGQWRDERPRILGSQLVAADSLVAPLEGADSWRAWFPEIVGQEGFASVVMNPPYGQLKVNQSTLPARSGDSQEAQAIRDKALAEARQRVASTAAALRSHPDYRFAHGGVPDLPRFFIERGLSLLREQGCLACIVPSTFLADHRSRAFRRHLLDDHRVREINLIPEDAHLFPDVNQPTCVIVVEARPKTARVRLRRRVLSAADLRKRPDVVISRQLITAVDPDERRIPNCAPEDLRVLKTMHEHPRLGDLTWIANLRGELDLTIDADYLRAKPPGHRLVRGAQIERYRSDLPSDKHRWVAGDFLEARASRAKAAFTHKPRIVLRQCSYLKKANRISGTVVDVGVVVANSCNFLAITESDDGQLDANALLLFLLGVLNSRIVDWRFRTTSSTNHVGNYELAALPIPIPDEGVKTAEIVECTHRMLRNPDDADTDHALERAVRSLYGLPAGGPR